MEENEKVESEVTKASTEEKPTAESKKADKPLMVPKDRFDEVNTKAKELERQLQEFKAAEEQAREQALKEQGEFKDLYEKEMAKAQKLEQDVVKMQRDNLRRQVAMQAGFPGLWNRISGDDEESLQNDLNALIEAIPGKQAPDIDAQASSGERSNERGKRKLTKAEKEYWAGVLGGTDPKYFPDTLDFEIT